MRAWLRRMWAWLCYPHDPEIYRLLNDILLRVDALAKQAHLPVHPPALVPVDARRDCGHVHRSAVVHPDTGATICGDCATAQWANYRRPQPPVIGPRWR